jgi:PKD repeat protein
MTTFKVEPETSSGSVGETITIDVNVYDAGGLWGWQVDMLWDPTILAYSSHTFGDFLSGQPEGSTTLIFLDNIDFGNLMATETTFGAYPGVTADAGWLISISFEVVGDGTTTIDIDTLFTYWLEDAVTVWGDEEGEMTKENGTFSTEAPPVEYTLSISVVGSGTTDPAPGDHAYEVDTIVDVDAIPDAGWMLDHWELDTVDVGATDPLSVTMDADHDLVAVFTEAPLTEIFLDPSTVSANPGETFTLDINVSDVTDLFCWGVKLGWPLGLLEVDAADIVEGPFLKQGGATGFAKKAFDDYIDCACTLLGAASGVNGSGTLVTVTFQVRETGDATLDLYSTTLLDPSLVEIPHVAQDGYFYTTWPVADFTYSPNPIDDPGHPIVGETITFDASPSYDPDGGTIVLYEWDFGDGTTDSGQTVTHAYDTDGSYPVTLTVTDDDGETYAVSLSLLILPPEAADEYFASVVFTPFDSDGDSFEDAVEVQMDVDTTDGTLWVYVDAYLIDPNGSIVDSDFPGWVITGTVVEYGYAHLYVPAGGAEGWYDVELHLYDEWWNYEDYEYGDDVLYYGPSAPSIYFSDAYLSDYVDVDGDGYYGSVTAYWDADVDDYVYVDVYVEVWGVDASGA